MLLPDNTGAVGFPGGTPAFARRFRPGLAGVGLAVLHDDATAAAVPFSITDPSTWASSAPAINSELVFLNNLYRLNTGQTPIAPNLASPTVNVGLNADTQKLLLYGGAGILLLFMLAKRSKKR